MNDSQNENLLKWNFKYLKRDLIDNFGVFLPQHHCETDAHCPMHIPFKIMSYTILKFKSLIYKAWLEKYIKHTRTNTHKHNTNTQTHNTNTHKHNTNTHKHNTNTQTHNTNTHKHNTNTQTHNTNTQTHNTYSSFRLCLTSLKLHIPLLYQCWRTRCIGTTGQGNQFTVQTRTEGQISGLYRQISQVIYKDFPVNIVRFPSKYSQVFR